MRNEEILHNVVWDLTDPYSRKYLPVYLVSIGDYFTKYELLPYITVILMLTCCFINLLIMYVCIRVAADKRGLGILIYMIVIGHAVKGDFDVGEERLYLIPILVVALTAMCGFMSRRDVERTMRQNSEYIESFTGTRPPWVSTLDGTLLLSLAYVLISVVILLLTAGNQQVQIFLAVGFILVIMAKLPTVGSNSSAFTIISVIVLILFVYSPMATTLTEALLELAKSLGTTATSPVHTHQTMDMAARVWQYTQWLGFGKSNPWSEFCRKILGIVFQAIMCLDDFYGPGSTVDAGNQAQNSDRSKKVDGNLGNYKSIWIISLVVDLAVGLLFGGPFVIAASIIAICLGTFLWNSINKKTWQGWGKLLAFYKMIPGVDLCVGDGPMGLRVLMLKVFTVTASFILVIDQGLVPVWLLVLTGISLFYDKAAMIMLGYCTGNVGLVTMVVCGKDVLTRAARSNTIATTPNVGVGTHCDSAVHGVWEDRRVGFTGEAMGVIPEAPPAEPPDLSEHNVVYITSSTPNKRKFQLMKRALMRGGTVEWREE